MPSRSNRFHRRQRDGRGLCQVEDLQLQVEADPTDPTDPTDPGHVEELLNEISGLFMRHEECGVVSGEPFLDLLEKSFQERWKIWQLLKWYN
eukprot:s141_g22.t1